MTRANHRQCMDTVRKPAHQRYHARAWLAAFLFLPAMASWAIQPLQSGQNTSRIHNPQRTPALQVQAALEPTVTLATGTMTLNSGAADFVSRVGGTWETRWDRRTDRPNLIQGSGIALIPGSGNHLSRASIGLAPAQKLDYDTLETLLDGFVADNQSLLRTHGMTFKLDRANSTSLGAAASHWFVRLDQYHQGVRVDKAYLYFRISHGNIVQFGSELVAPVDLDVHPALARRDALREAFRQLDTDPDTHITELREPGELLIEPLAADGQGPGLRFTGVTGQGIKHVLAWRFVFQVNDDPNTYEVFFNAKTNKVMEVRNLTVELQAQVKAGIYPATNTDPETTVTLPFAKVDNGTIKYTDADGNYDYTGGTASVKLDGKYFAINDNCGAVSLSNDSDGNLDFGTSSGTDCSTPSKGGAGNTHAARSAFYHLTLINRKAATFFPDNPWLKSTVTANVNINDRCNAFWDGLSLNFFKSGGGCSNTGELAAVFLHEWGHGLDTNTGGAAYDNGSGEAVGDTFAFLETRRSCIGDNFTPGQQCYNCNACTGVRDVAQFGVHQTTEPQHPVAKPSTVTDSNGIACGRLACPYYTPQGYPYQGPMGYEGHCESNIASGANWDLAQALVNEYGSVDGWRQMDNIWYGSLEPSKAAYQVTSGGKCNVEAEVDGCGANNWYTVYLAADDDDGNLANGTPNACRIWDAFDAHGIACGARPVCAASTPDFGVTTTAADQAACAGGDAVYQIDTASYGGFEDDVVLSIADLPEGVTASFNPMPVPVGQASLLTLHTTSAVAEGNYSIHVDAHDPQSEGLRHAVDLTLKVTHGTPVTPVLDGPADGDTGISPEPILTWEPSAHTVSYTIEIATDAAFHDLVASQSGLTATSYTVSGLDSSTRYYWRVSALNTCGEAISSIASFVTADRICHAPQATIPDKSTFGSSDTITIGDTAKLTAMKVVVKATHGWIGDLSFTLSHAGTSVDLLERPGASASSPYGCARRDVDVMLDDAATTSVQTQCNATPPAIGGTQKPVQPLAAFAGQSFDGAWTLTATDQGDGIVGTLDQWCLVPATEARTAPAAPYTVGGTVSGLAGGQSLVLQNNDGDDLAINGNGSFVFATPLADGASYDVTVASSVGVTCNVSHASGHVQAADVDSVRVACEAVPSDRIFMNGFEVVAP